MGYGWGSNLVHAYGTNRIPELFNNQMMLKEQKNREITKIIMGMASEGQAVDFKPGNPQYEGIAQQFGSSVAQGMQKRNEQMRLKRESEKKNAQLGLGITFLDNAFKFEEKLPGNKMSEALFKKAGDTFKAGGLNVDTESIKNSFDKKKTLKTQILTSLAKDIESLSYDSTPAEFSAMEAKIGTVSKYLSKDEIDGFNQALEVFKTEAAEQGKRTYEQKKLNDAEEQKKAAATLAFNRQKELKASPNYKDKQEYGANPELVKTLETMGANEAYRSGYRVEDNGKIYLAPDTQRPEKLPNFTDEMSKRGAVASLEATANLWQDTKELDELLRDPEVAKNLKKVTELGKNSPVWDRWTGSVSNSVRAWMTKNKIAGNSKTADALRLTQMMASEKRKEFLGSAVTETELKTILGWMPSPGDSWDDMIGKNNLMMSQGRQTIENYLNIYKDVANMSPFYRAFGFERVPTKKTKAKPVSPELKKQQTTLMNKFNLEPLPEE